MRVDPMNVSRVEAHVGLPQQRSCLGYPSGEMGWRGELRWAHK